MSKPSLAVAADVSADQLTARIAIIDEIKAAL